MKPCSEWLKEQLSGGSADCDWIRKAAFALGYTRKELTAARAILGIKTIHQVDTESYPRIDNWFWELPDNENPKRLGF